MGTDVKTKQSSINLIQVLQNWINETYSAYINASGNNKGYWLRIGENYGNDNRVPFVLSVNNVANAVIAYIAGIVNEDGTVKSINIQPIVGSNIYNNLLKDIALIENYLFIGKGADNSNSVTSKAEIKVYDLESDSFLTSDNGYDVLYNKVNIDHFFIEYLDSGSPYWNFVISAPVLINAYSSIDNNGILLTEIALESCSIDWGGGSVENFNKNSFISNLSYLGYDETNKFEAYVLGKKDGHYYAIQNVNNNLRIIKSNSLILKTDADGNALNTPPINVKSFTSSDGQLQIPVKGFITLKNDNFVLYNNTDKKYQLFDFEGNFIKDLVESQSNNLMFAYTNKTAYYTQINVLNNTYTELYSDNIPDIPDVPDDSWLVVEPMEGTGNTTIKVSSTQKNGRKEKVSSITAIANDGTEFGSVVVKQKPSEEYIIINQGIFEVLAGEEEVEFTGRSNCEKIIISLSNNNISLKIPDKYIVNGYEVANDREPIPGDPGASAEYEFSVKISVPRNDEGARFSDILFSNGNGIVTKGSIIQAAKICLVKYNKNEFVDRLTVTNEKINYGENATCEAILPQDNAQWKYLFEGWFDGSDKIAEDVNLVAQIFSDKTFTAVASRELQQYILIMEASDEGSATGSGTYDYGTNVNVEAIPDVGHKFLYWLNKDNGALINERLLEIVVSTNLNYKAIFDFQEYLITLEALFSEEDNTGVFTEGTTGGIVRGGGEYLYHSSVLASAVPNEGFDFVGWFENNVLAYEEAQYFFAAVQNRTLYAKFQLKWFTLQYDKNELVVSISKVSDRLPYGSDTSCAAIIPQNTAEWTYVFQGWLSENTQEIVSTDLLLALNNITGGDTYKAICNRTKNQYSVGVNAYYRNTDGTGDYTSGTTGGTVSGAGVVEYGSSKTLTATPATGYNFDGWYSAETGGTLLSSNTSYTISSVTANMTVYARFTKKYFTVSYTKGDYINNISRTSERVAYGANAVGCTLTAMTITDQYSYGVDGWYSGTTKVSSSATFAPTNVTADASYTAKGTRTLRSYTFTFNANGGNTPSSSTITKAYGSQVGTLPTCTKNSTAQYSYSFVGWFDTSASSGGTQLTTSTQITGNKTWYARFSNTTRSYSVGVSLDSSCTGKGTVSGAGTYNYGATAKVKCTLGSTKYVFGGWYNGTTKVSSNAEYSFTVTGAVTLTALIYYLETSTTSLSFKAAGETKTLTISTNISDVTVTVT